MKTNIGTIAVNVGIWVFLMDLDLNLNRITVHIVAQKWRNTKVILHKIKPTQILPIVMILLDLGAAAVFAWHKEYKKAVYWVSAAVLNATVTF